MEYRMGQVSSAVFVLGFLGWVALSARSGNGSSAIEPGGPASGDGTAASVACAEPIGWRVADVDPRFGVSRDWVASAVREAAETWRTSDGTPLFAEDPASGIPVRLEHDRRQTRLAARLERERDLRGLDASLRQRGAALAREREARHEARLELQRERAALRTDVTAHNQEVARWERADSVPAVVSERLSREAAELGRRDADLRAAAEELVGAEAALDVRERELDHELEARDRQWEDLSIDFPTDHLEAAVYRVVPGATRDSVHREIRVYTFRDRAELVWTLAHELGHALGLEHTADESSLMRGEQLRPVDIPPDPALAPADRRALEELCAPSADGAVPR